MCGETAAHWWIPLDAFHSAMLFALLAERWGLTKGFRIADQVCAVSICSPWMSLTRKAKRWCILSCLSKRAVETMEIQLSRKLVKLILCHCYEICHSVIDDITGPECGETISHQWIPVANDYWSGALMLQCVAMFAWMSCLTSSHDAYAMSLLCVIPHGWTSG